MGPHRNASAVAVFPVDFGWKQSAHTAAVNALSTQEEEATGPPAGSGDTLRVTHTGR